MNISELGCTYLLGNISFNNKAYDKAILLLTKVIEDTEDNKNPKVVIVKAMAYLIRSLAYLTLNKEEAITDFNQAIALFDQSIDPREADSNKIDAYYRFASILKAQGESPEVVDSYLKRAEEVVAAEEKRNQAAIAAQRAMLSSVATRSANSGVLSSIAAFFNENKKKVEEEYVQSKKFDDHFDNNYGL